MLFSPSSRQNFPNAVGLLNALGQPVVVFLRQQLAQVLKLVQVLVEHVEHVFSRFWRKMGTQVAGALLASRTVDSKPPLARSKMRCSSFSFSSTVRARANEVMCEMCDT